MALGEHPAQVRSGQMWISLQPAAGDERDRADDVRMRQLGPRRQRQVECLHARERLAPALGCLLAQAFVYLLLGHPLELAVVVEQAHGDGLVLAVIVACGPSREGCGRVGPHAPLPRVTRPVPGPWMTRNHSRNPSAQTTAVA